jgi:peptidoglycan hydrolase CwlO-like protein|tara:strand:+ start:280 stop:522 length:243 start_codon:yes stop_codon:yes gene_type:complete
MTEPVTDQELDPQQQDVVEESEVVELPPNVQQITQRMEELREEIGQITNVISANQKELDTRVAAFNWYSQQLEVEPMEAH